MFLKNTWYVAGPVSDFGDQVLSRRICNVLLAFYRLSDGTVRALEDRCPHRFVPLSMGSREGDDLRCGYHGLKFGPDGRCTEKPGGADENPAPISIRAYPVVERHGYAWIWMGEPERADADLIPDFSFITSPEYASVSGYLNIKAHHELITDNLLDLSHVNYLHPEIAPANHWTEFENKVVTQGNTVWSMLARPKITPAPIQMHMWWSDSRIADGRANVRWDAPSLLYADTSIAEVGADIETTGLKLPSAHLLTPETEQTTHYFWVAARNGLMDDAEFSEQLRQGVTHIFTTQDGPVIEAQQKAMGDSTDFLSHKPLILKADAAGIRARRVLRKLIREEQGDSDGALATAAE